MDDTELLQTAYQDWPLFAAMIDVAEMSLSKSQPDLARSFLSLAGRPDITEKVMREMSLTRRQVLNVLGHDDLLASKNVLGSAIALRAPYVDALSRLQLRALTQVRNGPADADVDRWRHLLLLTVNGAAAGLQNTG